MLYTIIMNYELDDWEKEDEEKEDEEKEDEEKNEELEQKFPVKKQTSEEKLLKEEMEQTNQQTVNDLFKVNSIDKLISIKNTNTNTNTNTNANMKTKSDYTNYAKECSNKLKTNKATSIGLLSFCKTIIDENCLKLSCEHLEDLLEHIHKLKDSKLFKPIVTSNKSNKQNQQQNHKEVFGDCTDEFDEEYLRIESNYTCGRHA